MRPEQAIIGAIVTARESAHAPATVTEAIEMFGGGKRGTSALAVELAGTSDKKSNAYKAALRNVERYRKGETGEGGETRKPGKAMREKLARIGEEQAKAGVERQMRSQGASIEASGTVRVSEDERDRELPELYVPGEEMATILDAYHAGDYGAMAGEFTAAVMEAYAMPGIAHFTDIGQLDITAGRTQSAARYD